jgi:ribulose-phosphate 3-epimerase
MTVDPGFAGQKLIPQMLDKIRSARAFLDERGYEHIELEVDGNVSFENAAKMYEAGADIFVAGSSSLFDKSLNMQEATAKLRSCIGMSESL